MHAIASLASHTLMLSSPQSWTTRLRRSGLSIATWVNLSFNLQPCPYVSHTLSRFCYPSCMRALYASSPVAARLTLTLSAADVAGAKMCENSKRQEVMTSCQEPAEGK